MRIYLIGFMGVGKTTIGICLAKHLNWEFVDTDREIETRTGALITEIFANKGEAFFRKEEYRLIKELNNRNNVVISTGGGLACIEKNMDHMLSNGMVIHLKVFNNILKTRLWKARKSRPLLAMLDKDSLIEKIDALWYKRKDYYKKAHLTIINNDECELIALRIVKKIKRLNIKI